MNGWRLLVVFLFFSLLWGCASAPGIYREAEAEAEVSIEQEETIEDADPRAAETLRLTESAESARENDASSADNSRVAEQSSLSFPLISAIPMLSGSRVENMNLYEDLPVPSSPVLQASEAASPEDGKKLSMNSGSLNTTASSETAEPASRDEQSSSAPQRAEKTRSEQRELRSNEIEASESGRSAAVAPAGRSSGRTEANTAVEETEVEETAELQEENPAQGKGDFQISAEVNENIQLSLSKKNWIYDRDKSKDLGLEFEGSRYLSDSKEFYFKAVSPGDYDLYFTSQDIETGSSSGYHVKVSVREEGAAAEDSGVVGRGPSTVVSNGNSALSPSGMFPNEYTTEFSNAALEAELSDRDIEGIQRQLRSLYASFSQLLSDGEKREAESVVWDQILSAAEELGNTEYEALAMSILEMILRIHDGEGPLFGEDERKKRAQIYYLLGGIYESPQQPRDERTAVEYYRKVLEIFPATIYHFKAEDRIKYLERHFLQIR